MSRVTLIDIYNERFNESSLKLSATADIEVVPRKLVEMIIEKCEHDHNEYKKLMNDTAIDKTLLHEVMLEINNISSFASALLASFEEDD